MCYDVFSERDTNRKELKMNALESTFASIDAFYNAQVAIIERAFERDMYAGKGDEACADAYHTAMRAAWNLRNARFDRACGWVD
jgi:hypothetical protein